MTRDSKTDGPGLSLCIRPANPADADGIARLQHLSHTTSFRPFAPAAWVAARDLEVYRRDWRERLSIADEFSRTWIALEGRDIVGVLSARWLPEDPTGFGRREAIIRSGHIHPQRIGLGIGRQLWHCVHSFLRDHRFALASLDVIAANVRARRFFERAGFRLVRIDPSGVEGVPIAIYEFELGAPYSAGERSRPAEGETAIDP